MSSSTFSLAELKDLFTLDEETDCQTHDLLGCTCMGKGNSGGLNCGTGSGGPDRAEDTGSDGETHSSCVKAEDDSESQTDGLPADLLPGLIKASQVDMAMIEEVSTSLYIFLPIFAYTG